MSGAKGLRWLALTARPRLPTRRRRHPETTGPGRPVESLLAIASLLAGFLVVVSTIAFGGDTALAVALGLSVAVLLEAIGMTAVWWRRRRHWLAWIGAGVAVLAVWTVVATAGTFDVGTARWIAFASGLGYSLYALTALLQQLLSSDRVVHVLEIRELGGRGQRNVFP